MKKIFLLRHGDTGCTDKYIGHTDMGLCSAGIIEINTISPRLQVVAFDQIFCSPLIRCRQTFDILKLDSDIKFDERLREINFGRWENKTFNQIEKEDPNLINSWAQGNVDFQFPEGENMSDFITRIEEFIEHIKKHSSEQILIISHGGVIRHLICNLLNMNYANYLYFQIKPGKLTTINLHNLGGVLTGMNIGE